VRIGRSGEITLKAATASALINIAAYLVQAARLGVDHGPASPLVLSNIAIALILSAIPVLLMVGTPRPLVSAYSSVAAGYVTFRVWGAAADAARGAAFQLAHGSMILLAWLPAVLAAYPFIITILRR